jgi:hypothetical protein
MMGSQAFPLTNHAEVLDIVADIRLRASHSTIIGNLAERCGTSISRELLQNSIDLSLRLMLMLDVGTFSNVYTGRNVMT